MTEPKASSFWSTLPGLVIAIAGMITAIAVETRVGRGTGTSPRDRSAADGAQR